MLIIDKAIFDTNCVICRNIDRFDESDRGLLSQNILAQLRNFVEYIAGKIYANGNDINPNDYTKKEEALRHLRSRGNLRFLWKFHDLLQVSVSHYTIDEGGSERLMLKYYEYLLKIKIFLKKTYNLDVLGNLENFPLDTDKELFEYHKKIADKIHRPSINCHRSTYDDRYYIQKIKPFFVDQQIFYEITFTTANSKVSKFDRVIAFTKLDILGNYAVKLSIHNDHIKILGKTMLIQVIDNWSVSVRPCELYNFANIFGRHHKISSSSNEYSKLMNFLTTTQMNIIELIDSQEDYYEEIKTKVTSNAKSTHIFDILDRCRKLIIMGKCGSNVIRYLLHRLNNKIIKDQYKNVSCEKLSNLYLEYGCIPFDQMPYASSLINHNPKLSDLLECISPTGRDHELLGRIIRNNTEIKGNLFTPRSEITIFDNINKLISMYNDRLYYKHHNRMIEEFHNHIYIKGYADDCAFIIQKLNELSSNGISQYTNSVDYWLQQASYQIDCPDKIAALRTLFSCSQVALIYGSAGTGKSTLINHLANFFAGNSKIFLANTNPAVDNMHRKVTAGNSEFRTIASFLSNKSTIAECDLLFIDECSTVSNADMKAVLEKTKFKLLVLVGDIFQIESISFGNWFSIARDFIPATSISELKKPYRSTNENLLLVWNRVRNLDIAILEPLVKNNYSSNLDETIFNHTDDDQIILCLNYDGLYGINNINRFLQNGNTTPSVAWGINTYKVGDPILFNESNRFAPLIYNNMKGKIVNIDTEEKKIWFEIELDMSINELDASKYEFELKEPSNMGNSIIRFSVNKYKSTDNDDDSTDVIVPFQIAYAVSIHKAQGLEYNSVKIVITSEIEERITHNIFYTAITRAKQTLKIYWSPETESKILNDLVMRDDRKDIELLRNKYHSVI